MYSGVINDDDGDDDRTVERYYTLFVEIWSYFEANYVELTAARSTLLAAKCSLGDILGDSRDRHPSSSTFLIDRAVPRSATF